MKKSENLGKNNKDNLSQQMETTARLQNAVSDKEAALNAVKKELERAKVSSWLKDCIHVHYVNK